MDFSAILLSIIISIILLINHWEHNKAVLFLIIMFFGFILRQLALLLYFSSLDSSQMVCIYTNFDPLFALIGPSFYFYFKSLVKGKNEFNWRLVFHLLPALLILVNSIPYYLLDLTAKLELLNSLRFGRTSKLTEAPHVFFDFPSQKMVVISLINGSYAAYTLFYLYKNFRDEAVLIKKKSQYVLRNLVAISIICISIHGIFAYVIFPNYILGNPSVSAQLPFYILLLSPICLFLFPSWLYGESKVTVFERFWQAFKIALNSSQNLPEETLHQSEDLNRIIAFIQDNKPYLKENFSLHDISRSLNIPHVRVTNCFNKQLMISFPVYRNKLRIDYATSLLFHGEHLSTSIEGIAAKAGFKSKSAFYIAFKAEHGTTPIEWIKENL